MFTSENTGCANRIEWRTCAGNGRSRWVDYVEMLHGEMCCGDGECADVWGVSSGGVVSIDGVVSNAGLCSMAGFVSSGGVV